MSDFLTRLAERQLGQIETIEPRIKPLYAPTAHESQAPSIVDEAASPPPPHVENFPTIQTSELHTPTFESRHSVSSATETKRTTVPHLVENHTELSERVQQFSADPMTRNSERIPRVRSDVEDVSSIRTKAAPVQSPTSIQRLAAVIHDGSDLPSNARPLLVSSAKTEPVAPTSLVNSTKDNLAQREVKLTAPGSLSTRNDRADERAKAAAEAPVQLTIGRIEVTALTQVAPPKRAALARKPSLSLDEYLARRHGRER